MDFDASHIAISPRVFQDAVASAAPIGAKRVQSSTERPAIGSGIRLIASTPPAVLAPQGAMRDKPGRKEEAQARGNRAPCRKLLRQLAPNPVSSVSCSRARARR